MLAVSTGYAQTTRSDTPRSTATPTAPAETKAGATMSKEEAKAAHDAIEQRARSDKKACESLKDNAQDVCEAEAIFGA